MIKYLRSIALAGVAAAAIVGVAASIAGAAPVNTTAVDANVTSMAAISGQAVAFHVSTPDGTLTYGWRPLASGPRSNVAPLSASGCNQDVCISIVGSSNHVDSWSSQAFWNGGETCTRSKFFINSAVIRTGTVVCGGAGVFFTDWEANKFFPSPSLACNTWTTIPGKPCETIHK